MNEEVITRQALGRIASLGELYDAHKDAFCTHTIFCNNIDGFIKVTDTEKTHVEHNFENTLNAKLNKLNVEAELKGSFLAGLVKIKADGNGHYLTSSSSNGREASASLICRMLTKYESIDISDNAIVQNFSLDAINNSPNVTHIVTAIQWGAEATAELIYKHQNDKSQEEINGSLTAAFRKLTIAVKAKGSLKSDDDNSETFENFQLKFYVDALPNGENIPQTVEEAHEFMKKIPKLIEKANGGKGIPLTYTMIPINSLKSYFKKMKFYDRIVHKVDECIIEEIVQVFDEIAGNLKTISNIYSEFYEYSYCLKDETISEISEKIKSIKSIQNGLRNDLYHTLVEVRYGRKNASALTEMLQKHQKDNTIPHIMLYCSDALLSCKEKIMFAQCLKNKRIIYIGRGTSLEAERLKNNIKEFFAFFCDWSNMQNRTENLNLFVDLEDVYIKVFIDTEVNPSAQKDVPSGNRICHYLNGRFINTDYLQIWKSDQSKCYAECKVRNIVKDKKHNDMICIKFRCPLSYKRNHCEKAEYQWYCYKCDELSYFEYRCSHEKHGETFVKFEYQQLEMFLKKYHSAVNYVNTEDCSSKTHFQPFNIKQEPHQNLTVQQHQPTIVNASIWLQEKVQDNIMFTWNVWPCVKIIEPTQNEIQAKCLEITYNAVTDEYYRPYNGSLSKGFESLAFDCKNIFRNVEKDWKKVYLCRKKQCETGEIMWKICFAGLKPKSISICCDKPFSIKGGNVSGSYFYNANEGYLQLHIDLSGGKGKVAWQHAQLFRCDLNNNLPTLLIRIEFE